METETDRVVNALAARAEMGESQRGGSQPGLPTGKVRARGTETPILSNPSKSVVKRPDGGGIRRSVRATQAKHLAQQLRMQAHSVVEGCTRST